VKIGDEGMTTIDLSLAALTMQSTSNIANDHACSVEHREEHAIEAIRVRIGSGCQERRCVQYFNFDLVRDYRRAVFVLPMSCGLYAVSSTHSLRDDC
jgi:hypothetical protein